jgi:LPS-assembly lipoprotein
MERIIDGLKPALQGALLIAAALAAAGCGFRPVYATNADDAPPLFQRIAIGAVIAPEAVQPFLVDALQDRMAPQDDESPRFELVVTASEIAERLAVQIDATVTRYNYRLEADYKLTDLSTGVATRGSANAVVSYNIVSSQYSTLFAERKAQEKAATILAREIERDLALRPFGELDETVEIAPIGIDAETEILQDPRSGEIIQPRKDQ